MQITKRLYYTFTRPLSQPTTCPSHLPLDDIFLHYFGPDGLEKLADPLFKQPNAASLPWGQTKALGVIHIPPPPVMKTHTLQNILHWISQSLGPALFIIYYILHHQSPVTSNFCTWGKQHKMYPFLSPHLLPLSH